MSDIAADSDRGRDSHPSGTPLALDASFGLKRLRSVAEATATSSVSILLALAVGAIIIAVSRHQWTAAENGYGELLRGAFGNWTAIQGTLVEATPLMFAGLAVAFAFRGGLVNLGAPGQYYAAGIASVYVGYSMHQPGWILLPVCVAVGAAAGAAWALIPALLKAYRGAHEVISTMMLNYVAYNLTAYLLNGTYGAPAPMQGFVLTIPQTRDVLATFPAIVPKSGITFQVLNCSFLLAILTGVVFWFLLRRTTLGFKVRVAGENPRAAHVAGISVQRTIVWTLLISGGMAGLAAVANVFGPDGNLQFNNDGFSIGFAAIAVALIGRNTAVGSILAAVLLGAFLQGGAAMQANAGIDPNLITAIEGLVVLFICIDRPVRSALVQLVPRTRIPTANTPPVNVGTQ